jgi:hypothetical protein
MVVEVSDIQPRVKQKRSPPPVASLICQVAWPSRLTNTGRTDLQESVPIGGESLRTVNPLRDFVREVNSSSYLRLVRPTLTPPRWVFAFKSCCGGVTAARACPTSAGAFSDKTG